MKDYGIVLPEEYCIGVELEEQEAGKDSKIGKVFKYGVSVPIRDTLRFYLKLPGIF